MKISKAILRSGFVVALLHAALGQEIVKQPKLDAFRFERPVLPAGQGPNRLAVDVQLLSGVSACRVRLARAGASATESMFVAEDGLSDLRIYDAANREVSYLLIPPAIPKQAWSAGRLLPVASTKKTSGFEVDLGSLQVVDRLRLNGLPPPFLKRTVLEGGGDRSHWTLLAAEGTLFDLPDEKLKKTDIEFVPGEYRYLRLTWDDTSSGRVPLPISVLVRSTRAGAPLPVLREPLQFERRASEPGKSRYRIRLPGARLPITALDIVPSGGNLLREAHVTEARLSDGEVVPVILGSAVLRRAVRGELAAADLRIVISPPTEAQLDLTIEDGNNPPFELRGAVAVFAHLPWIYLESAGTEPLTARFGYPDLGAPRYDLEAMRESVPKIYPPEARWGERRETRAATEILARSPLPPVGAAIDVQTFHFSRKIPGGPSGLTALKLDAAVLAHSKLGDLRIVGPDSRQIPYLLEKLGEPLSVDLPTLEKTEAKVTQDRTMNRGSGTLTFYRLRLPYEKLPPARLVVATTARVFMRHVTMEVEAVPEDARLESRIEQVAGATWSHADPETAAPPLTLDLPSLKKAEALLVVEEGDNSPLPLASPKLLLPAYRVRFFRETDSALALLYGRNDLEPPRYDLALLAPSLIGAAAVEIDPAQENSSAAPAASTLPKKVFWGALAAAVAILLFMVARLLRQTESEETK